MERELIKELGVNVSLPTRIAEDTSEAFAWSETEKRARRVAIRYHFIRDLVRDNVISVSYCPSKYMSSDIMTKPMSRGHFQEMRGLLRMLEEESGDKYGKEEYDDLK